MRRALGRPDDTYRGSTDLGCLIVGGGPAALAPLVAASREGCLTRLLTEGVAVVEQSARIGAGRIGSYAIWSDSTADSFLTAVRDHRDPRLSAISTSDFCDRLRVIKFGPISLKDAARLQHEVGRVLHQVISSASGRVYVGHQAIRAQQTEWGWRTRIQCLATKSDFDVDSRSLVIATGGYQPIAQIERESVAGAPLLPRFQNKLLNSDSALETGGVEAINARLPSNGKVVIVGGSTSAVAVADMLVRALPQRWGPGAITIMHRRPLRVFFHSAEAARNDGYSVFSPDDVCPITGFVYRLAGLRQRSRDLLVRVLGIGAPADEFRVTLHQLSEDNLAASQRLLGEADLIVTAMGYRPRGFSLFDKKGRPILLRATAVGGRLVDDRCRVIDRDEQPIDGVFGIGLASGFVLDATMGGETSFKGQANGLWLWQNNIGLRIAESLLDRCRVDVPAETSHNSRIEFGAALARTNADEVQPT